MNDIPTRLTDLAHGGGCGCKLSPGVLADILGGMPAARAFPDLLVGIETGDDAAVWRLNDHQALVATTDFFTPIVDDPFAFGRIAATNALSDVYAMGGTPILALAILGMPVGRVEVATIRAIVAGGASVCAEAGIPVAGGHSIDSPEPIYGLVAMGLVHPDRVLRNAGARLGDVLLLTKGLGIGVLSAALKRGVLDDAGYAAMLDSTTRLNRLGQELPGIEGVHAVTDVTGFGLLGHTLEMCRASAVQAELRMSALPLLPGVEALARAGVRTAAAARNWASYGAEVSLPTAFAAWQRDMLCDPQTSGGLLIAVSPKAAGAVLARATEVGFGMAGVIGEIRAGLPGVAIVP